MTEPNLKSYFLPYQIDWIKDPSRFKIWEKSRRIGATYAQSYEDVLDAAREESPMDVWFTSADESAAKEYILYCGQWARLFQLAAEDLGEVVLDKENDIKALVVEFANGKRIHGLSSNPTAFRSKGGKLVVDEYAFHKKPEELWKAAQPIVLWGFPIRVLSTYNGKGNRYYRMVSEAKQGNRWRLHTTTLMDAIAQGLVSKILGHDANATEIEAFIADARATAGDEENWLQEYMCQPVDEATAWLTWDLITNGEHRDAGRPELYQGGDCYVGMDIARRKHNTIIWVDERVGDVLWTREVVRMRNAKFSEQDAELDRVMGQYTVRRACIDQTGMGEKFVEDAQKRHGQYKVEGVLFTGVTKQHLAQVLKQRYEDRKVRAPEDKEIRAAHHAVRKTTTVAGNPRFDADQTEIGHADEFWAHALATHASEDRIKPAAGSTVDPDPEAAVPEAMQHRRRATLFGLGRSVLRGVRGVRPPVGPN